MGLNTRKAGVQGLNSRGMLPMHTLLRSEQRADCQCTTGLITALAGESTIITTPENIIGQGVVVTNLS